VTVDAYPVRDGSGALSGRRYAIRPTGAPAPNLSAELVVKTASGDQPVRSGEVALADLGLKVFNRHHTLFYGRRYQVTEIDRTTGEIRVARDMTRAQIFMPVVRLQLHRRLSAGQYTAAMPQTALIDAAESELDWVSAARPKAWNRMRSRLYFAHFRRETICAIGLTQKSAPLDPKTKLDVVPSIHNIYEMERRYQPALILEFDLSKKPVPTEVAATLAIAMQDVIRAEFSQFGHRVHCFARQATKLFADGNDHVMDLHDKGLTPQQRVDAMILAHYPALKPEQQDTPPPALPAAADHPMVEIVIVEDNDSDLGIVHAIDRNDALFLKKVHGYLDWLVHNEAGVSRYHRFGGPANSSFLKFSEAHALLPDADQDRIAIKSTMFPVFGRPRTRESTTNEAELEVQKMAS
jgi:hypothetical protein